MAKLQLEPPTTAPQATKKVGHRGSGRYLMVQRQFKRLGIPRMYRSSGTDDPSKLAAIDAMLTQLADEAGEESVALLKMLAEGKRTFSEALRTFQRKGLDGLQLMVQDAPIDSGSFEEWLQGHNVADSTRKAYRSNYATMMNFAKAGETMRNLPEIMDRYRAYCVRKKRNYVAWNHSLAVCKAWVKKSLGRSSKTYGRLIEHFDGKMKQERKHSSNPYFSPTDIRNLMNKLPEEVAAMVWTMCSTGAGPKEYLEDGMDVTGGGIRIRGRKNIHRDRMVPLAYPPAPIRVANYSTFLKWVKRASSNTVTPYDFRRTFARWSLLAGISPNNVRNYMGHGEQEMTDFYTSHDTSRFLKPDAERLREWIEQELEENPPEIATVKVTLGVPGRRKAKVRKAKTGPNERKRAFNKAVNPRRGWDLCG